MVAVLLASGHALDKHFDPSSVLGKRVRIEILLDWNLCIPEGRIQSVVELTPRRDALAYAVNLESEMKLESRDLHPGTFAKYRRPRSFTVDRVVVAIRRIEAVEEELRGGILSELTAPLLYYVRSSERNSQKTMSTDRDLEVIGPCRIVVLQD